MSSSICLILLNHMDKDNLLSIAQSNTIASLLELLDINYNVIDCHGKYLIKNFHNLADKTDATKADPAWQEYKKVMSKGEKIVRETYSQNKWYLSIQQPIMVKNKCTGIAVANIDITDRKETERKLKETKRQVDTVNLSKIKFLQDMRHDTHTPLTGIMAFAELIKEEAKNTKIKEYATSLVAACNTLLNFHNEIFDFATLAKGEIRTIKKQFSLRSKLDSMINLNKPFAINKHISLTIDHDENIPELLIGDPVQVGRIFLELISNAVHFTSQGSVKISTHLDCSNDQYAVIKIIVADTGIGMTLKRQHEILSKLKQPLLSLKSFHKGSGLGLYIVKELIANLKGEIYLESEPHKGSTFFCLLPFEKPSLNSV